jgi:TRAP-type C4-dicarboxylate transport system permease small subunit
MGGFQNFVLKLSNWMHVVAAIALTFIMLLTVSDVVLRLFGHPIVGTFELVGLGGAVIIGFGIPITSWNRGHIFVDFLINMFPKGIRDGFNVVTRLISMGLFILVGWNLIILGNDLLKSGEVTLTRQLPFYPVAYGLAICCFIECLVLISDLTKIGGGQYE